MTEFQQAWDRINAVVHAEEDNYKVYSDWADNYDKDVKLVQRVSNEELAKNAVEVFRNDESSVLLDVAAGTGLTAQCIRDAGFKGIMDAIDINDDMLQKAREKGIYRNIMCQKISPGTSLPVDDGTYDAAALCGALGHNHLDAGCVVPIIRTLKRGGVFVFNTRDTKANAEFKAQLDEILGGMVKEDKIKFHTKQVYHYRSQTTETGGVMYGILYVVTKL